MLPWTAVRRSQSQLISTFFGLTIDIIPQVRKNLFKQIHEIVFHGKGGYDWNTIYNMPIWLRKFTFYEINNYYKQEQESYKKATSQNKTTAVDSSGKVNPPAFSQAPKQKSQPSYVTRTSKK